jgi:hypothetical protein
MFDRSVRSLINLKANASGARTLNLLAVWKTYGDTQSHAQRPFFSSGLLNRAIIVKHRVRRDEKDLFKGPRQVATKVILPLDPSDLKIGGQSFFVDQTDYPRLIHGLASGSDIDDKRDDQLLRLLDGLPSLDPFLMRERLRDAGYLPARCYFDLSEADARRMYGFLREELEPLIEASFGQTPELLEEKSARLASKILANANDEELEPLRLVLGMSQADFAEGMFCWKGYVYYKWRMSELLPQVRPVALRIASIRTFDTANKDGEVYIAASRSTLKRAITQACRSTHLALQVYDDAFADLTRNGQPKAFREFLLRAPEIFRTLGERLGVLEHIVSFWRYRFPDGEPPAVRVEELRDIFMDFETGLNATIERPARRRYPAAA